MRDGERRCEGCVCVLAAVHSTGVGVRACGTGMQDHIGVCVRVREYEHMHMHTTAPSVQGCVPFQALRTDCCKARP